MEEENNQSKQKKSKIEKNNIDVSKPKRGRKPKEKKEITGNEKNTEKNKDDKIEIEKDEKIDCAAKRNSFNTLEVVIIMFITLCFGCFLGSILTYSRDTKYTLSNIPEELQEFINTYNDILDNYYEEIDKESLLDAGIEGMINFLGDKYSVYMDKEETSDFNEQVEGKYTGIGCELKLQDNETVTISKIFSSSPAEKSGIKIGDIITKVDDESVKGLNPTEISSKVKGISGTEVSITVLREDKELTFHIVRDSVDINSVTSKVYKENDKNIGYIAIDVFASNTLSQFRKELTKLEDENISSLIIDVRNNSGGYLSTVKDIASIFLESNKIVYQLDTRGEIEKIYSGTKESRNYPIALLVNHYSASASEILASALNESYGAEIVGSTTYGKGTVQKAYQLDNGATVKYTIQKWLTPNGNWINEKGITPTTNVELDLEYYNNPTDENDNQLQKAIQILSEK